MSLNQRILHCLDRLRLVVLQCHDSLCVGKKPQHYLKALEDSLGLCAHQLVVTCDVRLALGSVGNDVLDCGRVLGHELDVCRETCSAKADDSGILDLGHYLLV